MKNQIRIAIAEPKSLSFETLSNMLSSHKPLTVIQSFRNGRQVLQHLNEEITDILLLSYELLKIVNADYIRVLKNNFPNIKIIVYNAYDIDGEKAKLVISGINGFTTENDGINQLLDTINGVVMRHYYFTHRIPDKIIRKVRDESSTGTQPDLTPRETEIIRLLCDGQSHKQIASLLFITTRTVDFHKSNIYRKTNTDCMAKLYGYAHFNNLLDKYY